MYCKKKIYIFDIFRFVASFPQVKPLGFLTYIYLQNSANTRASVNINIYIYTFCGTLSHNVDPGLKKPNNHYRGLLIRG